MSTDRGVATLVRKLDGFTGDARLYRVDPPLADEPWDDEEPTKYEYVIVSAAMAMFSGPETYIFGADENGEVVDWGELPGSFRGGLDHAAALKGAGYEATEGEA